MFQVVNTIKWLKLVMGMKSKPFTADSPLPSDVWLRVDNFSLTVCDDPFEVKLGDNYAVSIIINQAVDIDSRTAQLAHTFRYLCRICSSLCVGDTG